MHHKAILLRFVVLFRPVLASSCSVSSSLNGWTAAHGKAVIVAQARLLKAVIEVHDRRRDAQLLIVSPAGVGVGEQDLTGTQALNDRADAGHVVQAIIPELVVKAFDQWVLYGLTC
jgi:hypothetical protein